MLGNILTVDYEIGINNNIYDLQLSMTNISGGWVWLLASNHIDPMISGIQMTIILMQSEQVHYRQGQKMRHNISSQHERNAYTITTQYQMNEFF